jgi:hypothetical protein
VDATNWAVAIRLETISWVRKNILFEHISYQEKYKVNIKYMLDGRTFYVHSSERKFYVRERGRKIYVQATYSVASVIYVNLPVFETK